MSGKQKTSVTVANITSEMIIHFALIAVQLVALVLIAVLVKTRDWTYWLILAVLICLILYFGFMTGYKLYRSRLTLVRISKDGVEYRHSFKKVRIPAERLCVALCDYGKNAGKTFYAYVFEKDKEGDAFLFRISYTRSLKKLLPYAPTTLLRFVIACTDAAILTKMREETSDELAEYITTELDAREQKRIEAEKAAKRKKKRR